MNKLNISLLELLNMLETAESHFKGEKALDLLVDKINKKKGKKSSKKKLNPKASISKKKAKKVSIGVPVISVAKKGIGKGTIKTTLQV